MSTILQHTSNIRALIRQHGRNDDIYTDQYLYELLIGVRADYIKQQLSKFKEISPWLYQTFDIPFTTIKDTVCDSTCGKAVQRSVFKIPKPIDSDNGSSYNFFTGARNEIIIVPQSNWNIYLYDEIKSKSPIGSIVNDYLYLWNNTKLLCAKVEGLWEDPTTWTDVQCCGSTDPCFDIKNSNFPLGEDKKLSIYIEILKLLKMPLELRPDLTNDSNEQIKA